METLKSATFLFLVFFYMFVKMSEPLSPTIPSSPNRSGPLPDFFLSAYPPPPVPVPVPVPVVSPTVRGIKAAYWPSFDNFPASAIHTSFFTHVYYAFLLPEPNTFELKITPLDQQKLPELTVGLRAKNPPVKAMLSIGGGGNDPDAFARMANTKQTRGVFINSTIYVARRYRFDGVDLDWEFPETVKDMANLGLLVKEWRMALKAEAKTSGKPRLLLTSAVYYSPEFTTYGLPRSYPARAMAKYLDWVSPMCFDYHGKSDEFTGIHSALYDQNTNLSTTHGIGSWIRVGIPPEKLVMGLATYGHTWKLQDPNINGIGAPTVGVGPGDEDGFFNYYAIVDFIKENNATVKFDLTRASFFSYVGNSWIGYDDVRSINIKVGFARLKGLAGYFFWAVGYDKDWALSRQASKAWR